LGEVLALNISRRAGSPKMKFTIMITAPAMRADFRLIKTGKGTMNCSSAARARKPR